jgi:hypothetical protein
MDYLISLVEAYRDQLSTIAELINYFVQNPFTKNDLMFTLGLVKDISKLKSTKNNLEEMIITALNKIETNY